MGGLFMGSIALTNPVVELENHQLILGGETSLDRSNSPSSSDKVKDEFMGLEGPEQTSDLEVFGEIGRVFEVNNDGQTLPPFKHNHQCLKGRSRHQ